MIYSIISIVMFVLDVYVCFTSKTCFFFVLAIVAFSSFSLCYFLDDTKHFRVWTSITMLGYALLMIVSLQLHFVYGKYIADYALATMQTVGLLALSITYHFKKPRKKIS